MNIVVGMSGGIAAYKAVGVIRALVLAGHDVHVVPTEAALRFVGRPTLEAISRNPVETDLYDGVAQVRHVAIGQAADVIVVAPATANTLAKLATGLADDLLGTTVLASTAPVVVAPAMHTEMWANAATVHNVNTLRRRGVIVVGPSTGQLTGTDVGAGRMAEPDEIVGATLAAVAPKDLAGRRILVTAGGTREPLDPVRFIGNRSSGRQGIAIAAAAARRGAEVVLVCAHIEVEVPSGSSVGSGITVGSGTTVEHVGTALELQATVNAHADAVDAIIMAAAVADYRPTAVAEYKIKKDTVGEVLTLNLVQNPDILAGLASARRPGQVIVGFAAETEADDAVLLDIGRKKIARKGADYLVVNRVGWTEGFSTEDNSVFVLNGAGAIVMEASGSKLSVADRILALLA